MVNPCSGLYKGRDAAVVMGKICNACKKKAEQTSLLQICSRCQIVHYCSKDCQKKDFPKHKSCCKLIKQMTLSTDKEAEQLKTIHTNLLGNFLGLNRARFQLANVIYGLACEANPPQQIYWEVVIGHYQEMMCLCRLDDLGHRFKLPFLLLEANRDDDAACFISYWLREEEENENYENIHSNSSEGDWIYPREKDARFSQVIIPTLSPNLAILVAAATIKMRLVAMEMSHVQAMQAYTSTEFGIKVDPVQHVVEAMLMGSDTRLQGQLDHLLDIIHQNNSIILPDLLNPEPLLSQPRPGYYFSGSPSEAYFVLENAHRIWSRIPGASAFLEERFGLLPAYNFSLDTC
jgi:MYND finger